MKKITVAILLLLQACYVHGQGDITVLESASMFADMASNVGGDMVIVESLVPIGGDPHLYSPRPSDAQKVQKADLVLVNGLTFEGWIAKLVANSGATTRVDTITKGIVPRQSEEYENSYDPHAWMTARNGLIYVDNIAAALAEVAPQHRSYFEANAARYKSQLEELHEYILTEMKKIPAAQRVLITSHDAFAYFGNEYGLQLNALKGISTEEETQASDMLRVAKAIKETGVKAIFVESTISPKMIQQIATDNKVKVGGELYADSLGPKGGDAGTYITMLRHNCDTIVKALTATEEAGKTESSQGSGSNMWLYILLGIAMLTILGFVGSRIK